jgi:hypothetical protein
VLRRELRDAALKAAKKGGVIGAFGSSSWRGIEERAAAAHA